MSYFLTYYAYAVRVRLSVDASSALMDLVAYCPTSRHYDNNNNNNNNNNNAVSVLGTFTNTTPEDEM